MSSEHIARLRGLLDNDFNRVNNPISQAEYDVDAAKVRLAALLDNGQRLDPPLVLAGGPQQSALPAHEASDADTTADPLRRPGKATYMDPVEERARDALYKSTVPDDYKSFADELDAERATPADDVPSSSMSRDQIQAKLGEELNKLATPKLVYSPPPPSLGPDHLRAHDDDRRAVVASLQRQLDEPTKTSPMAPAIDPLAPEPLEKAQADYNTASAQLHAQGPEIEPE